MAYTSRGWIGLVTALIYTRVSSEDQAREGVSLDAQLAESRRYVAGLSWAIGGEYQDVLSGTRDDRRQYRALLAEARRLRAEGRRVAVVVAALDRFGRKLLERVRCREELKALGVPVHSVREGGEVSDLVANVLAAVAEEEVRRLGERVSAAKQHLIGGGWYPGGRVPWGYRLRPATAEERALGAPQAVLDIDPERATYAREMFRRVAEGQSVRSVVRWLGGLSASVRGGRALAISGVRRQLGAGVYVARPEHDDPDVLARPVGRWPAMVDDTTWWNAQEKTARHRHMPKQASGRYLLSGLLYCPACGSRMSGRRHRKRSLRYGCNQSERPGGVYCYYSLVAAEADVAVWHEVVPILDALTKGSPPFRASLRQAWQRLRQAEGDGSADTAQRIRALVREADRARERLKKSALLLVDGLLDKAGYDLAGSQAQADLAAAESELARLRAVRHACTLPPLEMVLASAAGWSTAARTSPVTAQRDVLAALIERILPRKQEKRVILEIAWTSLGAALCDAVDDVLNQAS
jgi:site-specific DNA recombinase